MLLSVSNALGSIGIINSSLTTACLALNSSMINANASISSLIQRNSDITNLNNSTVNLSLNFWNLSGTTWAMSYLPAAFSNLSTTFWVDDSKLTQNINSLSSVSTVAYNSWNAILAQTNILNNV